MDVGIRRVIYRQHMLNVTKQTNDEININETDLGLYNKSFSLKSFKC